MKTKDQLLLGAGAVAIVAILASLASGDAKAASGKGGSSKQGGKAGYNVAVDAREELEAWEHAKKIRDRDAPDVTDDELRQMVQEAKKAPATQGFVHIGRVGRVVEIGAMSVPRSDAPTPFEVANKYAASLQDLGISAMVKPSRDGHAVSFTLKPSQQAAVDALTSEFKARYTPWFLSVRSSDAKWVTIRPGPGK